VELITAIARALVDNPDRASVEEKTAADVTRISLTVDPEDVRYVIGKQSRTARALRTLLGAISVKLNRRYSLEIIEDLDEDLDGGTMTPDIAV
jgi:uncharacterized protein